MIINTDEDKKVEQVGDIENNSVSIDTSNIDFIVTLLSTSLYSKPIESFIRETVSNAWDSHVEAKVNDPVILELGKDTEGKKFCRVQDFGVGLSPERFDSVYKNIGSSTKRSDNSQIGGFGIGRFSALAYSDVVHITSVHGGQKYLYMMYKDGNSISIDMLHQQDTDERNGLEVKVEIQEGDYYNFSKAIKSQLVYFENLYIIDSTVDETIGEDVDLEDNIQHEYNNFSIKKYKNFWVNSLDGTKQVNLVLGKVRYPVRIDNLDKHYSNKVSEYPISLKFDIGDLEVTPNREEILYSNENKKVIEDRLDLALEEIEELTLAEKSKDYDKYSKYLEALDNTQYLMLLSANDKEVKLKLSDSKRNLTLNGQSFDGKNFKKMHNKIMSHRGVIAQYSLQHGQIKYANTRLNISTMKKDFENVFLSDLGDVKNITKRYVRETFEDYSWFIKLDSRGIKYYIKEYMKHLIDEVDRESNRYHSNDNHKFFYDSEAFKVICKYVLGNLKFLKTFNNSKVPSKWISDTKAADKAKRGNIKKQGFDWKQNINVHELEFKNYGGGIMTNSTPYVMKDLSKEFKALTVYAEKDNSKLRTLFAYLKEEVNLKMIELAPTKVKLLKEVENFVKIDDFMSTDYKLIRNIATVEFLRREMPFLKELARIHNIEDVSTRLATVVYQLNDFVEKYESAASRHAETKKERELISEIFSIAEEKDFFNEEIRGVFLKHKEELMNSKFLIDFVKSGNSSLSHGCKIPENRINLVVDYFLSRKLIRPSVKAVVKLKTETIFNIKTEENESNEN